MKVSALFLLTAGSALVPAVSGSPLEITSYKDETMERFLSSGTNCASSASVRCTMTNREIPGPLIDCADFQVRNAECPAGADRIESITLTWDYCNTENSGMQLPISDLTQRRFRSQERTNNNPAQLPAGECKTFVITRNVDFCNARLTMSMKYEGLKPGLSDGEAYCFAFAFTRFKIRRIFGQNPTCAATTDIRCRIRDGSALAGAKCVGNLIDDGTCRSVKTVITYRMCVWNANSRPNQPNTDVLDFTTGPEGATLRVDANGVEQLDTVITFTPSNANLLLVNRCRFHTEDVFINTCDTLTETTLAWTGVLNSGDVCNSRGILNIRSATVCPNPNFILTELVDDGAATFIEIYSPNCPNTIITEDLQIVRLNRNGNIPPSDLPINLRGLMTDANGFLVICENRNRVNNGVDRCAELEKGTEVELTGRDSVAIVRVPNPNPGPNENPDFEILDFFGRRGSPLANTDLDFRNNRAVRAENPNNLNPNPANLPSPNDEQRWIISSAPTDAGEWFNFGGPTVAPTVPPVTPTLPPVTPTVPPVTPTLPPVAPTVPPVTPTLPPVAPTLPPVAPTLPPVAPTLPPASPPSDDGGAGAEPTVAPVAPTVAPVAPTLPPVAPTVIPVAPPTESPIPDRVCNNRPFITEVSVIDNKVNFIEVRASVACAYNTLIETSLELTAALAGSLQTFSLPNGANAYGPNGFFVICFSDTMMSSNTCDITLQGQAPDTPNIDLSDETGVVDQFFACQDQDNCITPQGRTYRRFFIDEPNQTFGAEEWFFTGLDDATPGAAEPFCDTRPFITELSVTGGAGGVDTVKFIELRAQNECAYGGPIIEDVNMETFTNIFVDTPLQGLRYDNNGFYVFCDNFFGSTAVQVCDSSGLFGEMPRFGDLPSSILVELTEMGVYDVARFQVCTVDDCLGSPGRAYRKRNFDMAEPTFDINQWVIGVFTGETPGAPEDEVVVNPTNAPTIAPTVSVGKGGKGKQGKRMLR